MLAVVGTVNPMITLPSPLVATTLPDATATVRVAGDNVAPSVSIPFIDPNSKGLSAPILTPASAPPASAAAAPPTLPGTFLISTGAGFWASPQAPFLAQMMGQDLSPEAHGVLVQYERLMSMSAVKYKPSNATMPQPEPSGVFGRILQEEQAAAPRQAAMQQAQATAAPVAQEKAATLSAQANVQPVRAATNAARAGKSGRVAVAAPSSQAVNAYKNAAARAAALSAPQATPSGDKIEEINAAA